MMRALVMLALLAISAVVPATEVWMQMPPTASMAVVVPETSTDTERYAAQEFAKYWQEVTGTEIPVRPAPAPGDDAVVWIGNADLPEWALGQVDLGGLGRDGIVLKTFSASSGQPALLVLTGGTPNGPLYAVYEFLERQMGVRFLTPFATHVPKTAPDSIPALDVRYVPQIERRVMSSENDWRHQGEELHQRFVRIARQSFEPSFGEFVHTSFGLLDPRVHFAERPEYFAEINGKRTAPHDINWDVNDEMRQHPEYRTQLCYSNPEVPVVIAEELRRRMRERPQARIWSVSQMDWGGFCECAECTSLNEREGTPMGSVLTAVNKVADLLREEFPQNYIETLAYGATRKPPKTMKPRDNVIISVCNIECNMAFAMDDRTVPDNWSFYEHLRGWGEITDNIYFWHYPDNCAHPQTPFPNFHVLDNHIRAFADNGGRGTFLCGGGAPEEQMGALRQYLEMKLLWDPNCDYKRHMEEFLDLYYGAAADAMRDYLELARKTVVERRAMVDVHDKGEWIDYAFVTAAQGIMDKALASAGTPETEQRVRQASASVAFAAMLSKPRLTVERDRVEVRYPERMMPEAFAKMLYDLKVPESYKKSHLEAVEHWPITTHLPEVQTSRLVVLENDSTLLWIAPGVSGSILRWYDKGTRTEWLTPGEQEQTVRYLTFQDWDTKPEKLPERPVALAYEVIGQQDSAVTLAAEGKNGLRIEKEVALLEDAPGFSVMLRAQNTTDAPLSPNLKLHPELFTQDPVHPRVFQRVDGVWSSIGTAANADALSYGALLEAEGDAWGLFVPEEGVGLVNEYKPDALSKRLLFYKRENYAEQANLELLMDNAPLGPGETRALTASYRTITQLPALAPHSTPSSMAGN